MKAAFTTLFAALAAALPQNAPNPDSYENVDIADFTVRKNEPEGTISAVSFKLSGDDAKDLLCEASDPSFPSDVITCGVTKYRFALFPSENQDEGYEFNLRLYHELGPAFGFYGEGDVPTYCHAGGNGVGDFICTQVNPTTIVIDGQ